MKKLLIITIISLIGFTSFSQSGCIKKECHYSDTTISKVFFTYNWSMTDTKSIHIVMTCYLSKSALRNGSPQITVPEIIRDFDINTASDQTKTLEQLDTYIKNAVKTKLKELNPTWTNSDFEWYL